MIVREIDFSQLAFANAFFTGFAHFFLRKGIRIMSCSARTTGKPVVKTMTCVAFIHTTSLKHQVRAFHNSIH